MIDINKKCFVCEKSFHFWQKKAFVGMPYLADIHAKCQLPLIKKLSKDWSNRVK